ncbi:MAG: hypothetical protein KC503_44840 [Myxococcales bacterium]|nr:hypothetical protein [Myxococcales bacterium]
MRSMMLVLVLLVASCGGSGPGAPAADTFSGSVVPDASPTFDLTAPLAPDTLASDSEHDATSADASSDTTAPPSPDSSVDSAPPSTPDATAPPADSAAAAPSWSTLPGNGLTLGRPAGVVRGGQLYLFVVGTTGETWQNIRVAPGAWSGWAKMPNDLPLTSFGPVVTVSSGGTIDLLVRAADGTIHAKRRGATSWAKAQPLAGVTAAYAPAAYYDTDSKLHVLAVDSGSRIYESVRGTSSYSGWSALTIAATPAISGAPAVVVDKGKVLRLFVRDGGGAIWRARRIGKTWLGFSVLDNVGRTPQSPTAALDASGEARLFVRGMDDKLWSNRRVGAAWQGWQSHGGVLSSAPGALVDGGMLRIFSRGTSNAIETCYPL